MGELWLNLSRVHANAQTTALERVSDLGRSPIQIAVGVTRISAAVNSFLPTQVVSLRAYRVTGRKSQV